MPLSAPEIVPPSWTIGRAFSLRSDIKQEIRVHSSGKYNNPLKKSTILTKRKTLAAGQAEKCVREGYTMQWKNGKRELSVRIT